MKKEYNYKMDRKNLQFYLYFILNQTDKKIKDSELKEEIKEYVLKEYKKLLFKFSSINNINQDNVDVDDDFLLLHSHNLNIVRVYEFLSLINSDIRTLLRLDKTYKPSQELYNLKQKSVIKFLMLICK